MLEKKSARSLDRFVWPVCGLEAGCCETSNVPVGSIEGK